MAELLLASILIGLAAYRAWRIVGKDKITEPLRAPILKRSDRPLFGWIFDLIDCPWCLGFWISGLGALLVGLASDWGTLEFLLVWLASSAVCGLLERLDG